MTFERIADGHWRATARPCWEYMPEVVSDATGIRLRGSWPPMQPMMVKKLLTVLRKALIHQARLQAGAQLDALARRWVDSRNDRH